MRSVAGWTACLYAIILISPLRASAMISVVVWPKSVFPSKLGDKVTWTFTPVGGEYATNAMISFKLMGRPVYRAQRHKCDGPLEVFFSCVHKPTGEISVSFTPNASHYGSTLMMYYYEDVSALWLDKSPPIYSEIIQLTKQPDYVKMSMQLREPSRYLLSVPTSLKLDPPIFLTGSTVRIECTTDGSLPPAPITFSVECPPPSTAVVEHDRVTQAKRNLSYEIFYRTYGFLSPPTLSELAPYVARKHAEELLRLGHVSTKNHNLTLLAILSINEKAHDCHVVCRLGGKETRRRMTVYHPTTVSYLLPRPRDGFLYVGSEMTCYADGHPPPALSLRLTQPLRPPKPLSAEEIKALQQGGRLPLLTDEDPIGRELTLSASGLDILPQQIPPTSGAKPEVGSSLASSGTLHQIPMLPEERWHEGNARESFELGHEVPGLGLSTIERHRQLGLRPNEYSIQGATFYLAPNATPGVELVLTCTARNVLPGDTTFLGLNGTITRTRFVVAALFRKYYLPALSPTSWVVALGVCACILLIVLIIIGAMLLQKKAQNQANQMSLANLNGANISKPYKKDLIVKTTNDGIRPGNTPLLSTSTLPNSMHFEYQQSSLGSSNPLANGLYHNDPDYNYDPVYIASSSAATVEPSKQDLDNLQYVELSFDHVNPTVGAIGHPMASVGHPEAPNNLSRGVGNSASMTLFGTGSRNGQPRRPMVASVPHGLDSTEGRNRNAEVDGQPDYLSQVLRPRDESSSHYTEIVGFMQPKAYASQLVLQQQQEATQALLAMQQNKPRVFV